MGELWKQCGDWLVRLGVLPSNHRYLKILHSFRSE